jgi:hypothetical protein
MIDYYKLLGVLPTATTDEIKKAYRQLALTYHPDRNPGDRKSEVYFKKVNEAYTVLSDPEERENYNHEFKNFKRTSGVDKDEDKPASPKHEQALTPEVILSALQSIKIKITGVNRSQVNQLVLYNKLHTLLSRTNVNLLLSSADHSTNRLIIDEVLACCKFLPYPQIQNIILRLVIFAGSDNDVIQKIYSFEKHQKGGSFWKEYSRAGGVIAIIIFFLILAKLGSTYNADSNNNPADGDLNTTFTDGAVPRISGTEQSPPPLNSFADLTPEQKLQQQKEDLIADGWEEKELKNGELSPCYKFVPKKSKIDNYLEVKVGGGTDVAIKVMNARTQKCIGYVFINSGSTYKISNIPEGTYYLKIAYGKDWFSRVQNKQCVGKFISNPLYEKGDDMMNFDLKYTSDGYRIRSFQLQLDVIATSSVNTFSSQNISEREFNE